MKLSTAPVHYWRGLELEEFFLAVETPAKAMKFDGSSPYLSKSILKNSMEDVLVCTDQIRSLARQMLARADAHAEEQFKSPKQFISNVYSNMPWGKKTVPATAITGLAGTGKSHFLRAFERLIDLLLQVPPPAGKKLALTPVWTMSIRTSPLFGDLIQPWVALIDKISGEDKTEDTNHYKPKRLVDIKRRASTLTYREGVCLLLVDEFQFISRGATSNASAIALLLNLLSVGPRLGYVMNYDMGHRLMKRPQEDQDRLLVDPIEVLPERAGSVDFMRLLREYMSVAPSDFLIDPKSIEDMVHTYTFGLPRAMVNLLCEAWMLAKESRGRSAAVIPDDITRAYKKLGVQRTNVELLWKFGISDEKQRLDLRSPFAQPGAIGRADAPRVAAVEFEKRVMQKHLESSLTMEERLASKTIEEAVRNAALEQNLPTKGGGGRRKSRSKEDLLATFKEFDEGNL